MNKFLIFAILVLCTQQVFSVATNYADRRTNEAVSVGEVEAHVSKHITPQFEEVMLKKNPTFNCPLCDSSVYSYCNEKLLHDACCCLNPYDLPPQCDLADCSFLHANSCKEHRLITACCCNKLLQK